MQNADKIIIKNAHTNNLKNISLEIPKHSIVVFSGVSGSGKSSLLFDTIYTEAQRQLIETFGSFARARLPKLSRPDVDEIKNLSTPIVIDQKKMGKNLRSTVGTATELATYIRLLYSRIGEPFLSIPSWCFSFNHPDGMCPHCHGLGKEIKIDLDKFLDKSKSLRAGAIQHPFYKNNSYMLKELLKMGLFDNDTPLGEWPQEELDRLLYCEPVEIDKTRTGLTYNRVFEGIVTRLERSAIEKAEDELPEDEQNLWSQFLTYRTCSHCGGTRINDRARSVKIHGLSIDQAFAMEITDLLAFMRQVSDPSGISTPIVRKIIYVLEQLDKIGVGYLSLDRPVSTLSGGESQRVKMARQLDCDLTDLLYVLDEPSIGLHPRDTEKLIELLRELKDRGNSVFVVEHDPAIIRAAEWSVDIGPLAGSLGGEVVYCGPAAGLPASQGLTARHLRLAAEAAATPGAPGGLTAPVAATTPGAAMTLGAPSAETAPATSGAPATTSGTINTSGAAPKVRRPWTQAYTLDHVSANNLKDLSVSFPKGILTCVTGVAGCGKSSLVHDCFAAQHPEAVLIDQQPIGRTSRGSVASFVGAFNYIRQLFADESGQDIGLFSYNSEGACPKCQGRGYLSYEMSFLDAVSTKCDECNGLRYNSRALSFRYRGKTIAEVLDLTVLQAKEFFYDHKKILRPISLLDEVGLGYLKLGQTLSNLSGGESQRLKIAKELRKKGNIYIMDEPTTGLHMSDIDNFLRIVDSLVDSGNTVIIIEHNLDVIRHADWIIDLGPEGGKNGGQLLFEGTPEDLKLCPASITGRYL